MDQPNLQKISLAEREELRIEIEKEKTAFIKVIYILIIRLFDLIVHESFAFFRLSWSLELQSCLEQSWQKINYIRFRQPALVSSHGTAVSCRSGVISVGLRRIRVVSRCSSMPTFMPYWTICGEWQKKTLQLDLG